MRHKRFRHLPPKQQEAFEQIALMSDGSGFPRRTLEALERKGLIVGTDEPLYGSSGTVMDRIPMIVRRYQVPMPLHREWCQWCSENVEDG